MLIIYLSLLAGLSLNTLWIEKPQTLKDQLNYHGVKGGLDYSISTFGQIPYEEEDEIQVLAPQDDNPYGC